MICANEIVASCQNKQKVEAPNNFSIYGSHFVTWHKLYAREGLCSRATPITFEATAIECFRAHVIPRGGVQLAISCDGTLRSFRLLQAVGPG